MRKYIFSVLVGLVCVIPYILPIFSVDYKGIPFLYQDNEYAYLSRIREVSEGHYSIASPVFYEYKNVQQAQQPMGEWIYGFLGNIIPLNYLIIATKFLFPALLFLLIYWLVFRLNDRKNEYMALFAATACILGFDMVRLSFIKEILTGNVGFHLSIWTRLVNPITGALFLFSFLNILLSLWEKRTWKHSLFAGLILGLMTGYYFSFIVACAILGFVCIHVAYKRDFIFLKKLISIFVLGFIINLHYAWSLLHIAGGDAFKSGMFLTHLPLINKLQLVVLLLLGVTYKKMHATKVWIYGALFTVSSLAALNLHVITGRAIWPQHFVQYTNLLGIISVSLLFGSWFRRTFLFGILVIFTLAIFTIPSYTQKLDDFNDIQRLVPALAWLNTIKNDCVVLSYEKDAKIAWMIPAYTRCDSYISPYVFSSVPEERIMHNFLMMLHIRGGDFTEGDMRLYLFRDWRDMFAHQPDAWLSSISDKQEIATYFKGLDKKIKENYKDFTFEKKYKMDYIIWDSKNASSTDPRKEKGIQQVFEQDGIFIFTI